MPGPVIGIVGGSLSGNRGAEAMTTTAIRYLKRHFPDAEFVVFSPYARADRPLASRYPDTTVADGGPLALVSKFFPSSLLQRLLAPLGLRPSGIFRDTRRMARCAVVVDVAGVAFSDGRELYLPFNVLTILAPIWFGVPVVKLAQALGPFRHRLNRALARWLLPRCHTVVARGRRTAENLAQIGITDAPVCPDVAFVLNDVADVETLEPDLAARLEFGTAGRPLVGVCPSSVVFKACRRRGIDYADVNARFVEHLVARGFRVLLLAHSQRPGAASLKNNDLPVVRAIVERAEPSDQVATVAEELDSVALRKLIGRCDLFVASRFHSMVASLAMGVPTMVCGWGHKYREVLDEFGLGEFSFDCSELSLEALCEMFGRLAEHQGEVRAAIARALPSIMDRARSQLDAVVALLRGGGSSQGSSA